MVNSYFSIDMKFDIVHHAFDSNMHMYILTSIDIYHPFLEYSKKILYCQFLVSGCYIFQ